jgi:hypothetical protein
VTINRRRLYAQLAGDLLGVQVRMDEAQALALSRRQILQRLAHYFPHAGASHINHVSAAETRDCGRGELAMEA